MLNDKQEALCKENKTDYSPLSALTINCTLKTDEGQSHTGLLMSASEEIMRRAGAKVERVHMAARQVALGVQPDMTEHGAERDDWPAIWAKVRAADILLIGTPIWLGEISSPCRLLIERLYAMSGLLNDDGQSVYYGKVGGVVVTGNEDGIKHCAQSVLYGLQHLGYTIPPQADAGWIGEAGPGPSYGDEAADGGRVGFDNDFTQRNLTIMTWNLLHFALMLKQAGGIPKHGNDRRAWKAGCRFEFENPEHRV